jgi:hypothetical protein
MPRLHLFGVCEKVVIDPAERFCSLIGLLDEINLPVAPAQIIPPEASVPMRWAVLATWLRTAYDEDRLYAQRVQIFRPDEMEAVPAAEIQFRMEQRTIHNKTVFTAFPVGLPGEYVARLSLREVEAEPETWQLLGEYNIHVNHIRHNPLG